MNLEKIGVSKHELKCLKYIIQHEPTTAKDIEMTQSMRQPVVSIALKKLVDRGWVQFVTKKKGRGRPLNIYSLAKDPHEILNSMRHELEEAENGIKQKIDTIIELLEKKRNAEDNC